MEGVAPLARPAGGPQLFLPHTLQGHQSSQGRLTCLVLPMLCRGPDVLPRVVLWAPRTTCRLRSAA